MLEKQPERVIELAVKGMLPKNALGRQMRDEAQGVRRGRAPAPGAEPGTSYLLMSDMSNEQIESSEQPETAPTPVAPRARKTTDGKGDQFNGLGRRKTSVARVILRPGEGRWVVNGRTLRGLLPARRAPPVGGAAARGDGDTRAGST